MSFSPEFPTVKSYISSLYGLILGRTNSFTVSGNPISVSFSFSISRSSEFFANVFEQNCLLTKRIIVLDHLSRRWHVPISVSWILMSIFSKTSIHLSSSSLFFTLDETPSTTTLLRRLYTAWRVSKYGVFSVCYFPVFGLNTKIYCPKTWKYGPEKSPYLVTFHAVMLVHFIPSYIGTFKLALECFNSVF